MKTKVVKLVNRGGERTKRKKLSAQSALLQALWEANGGVFAVARKLDIHPQLLVNWKLRGRVPLSSCGRVARGLDVTCFALNFEEMVELTGRNAEWKEVLSTLVKVLPLDTIAKIESLKPPKLAEQILK